jgi:hypothetical protein
MPPSAHAKDASSPETTVVSTTDEHGELVEVVVTGTPEAVRRRFATRPAHGWVRFDTPAGGRVHLRPRGLVTVHGTNEAGQHQHADAA